MVQSEDNSVPPENAAGSTASVVAQPNDEDIPDDDPVLFFEWIDQHIQIFLSRWEALEDAGLIQNTSFERPQSVTAFHQRMLELFCKDIPGATLGQEGGSIGCVNSVTFSLVLCNMFMFESRQWVRSILGQEGFPGKLAHVSIATSVHNAQYPQFATVLF